MDHITILKLKAIFSLILELPANFDIEGVSKFNCRKWDSLAQVAIIAAIEGEFDLVIPTKDYNHLTSFASTVQLLDKLAA